VIKRVNFLAIIFATGSADDALVELVSGGYGFHATSRNIPRYLRTVNRDSLRFRIVPAAGTP
jgi:hypothetical protein